MPRRCKEKPDRKKRAERHPHCPYGGDIRAVRLHAEGRMLLKLRRDGFEALRDVFLKLGLGEPPCPPVVGWTEETLYVTEVYHMICLDRFYKKTGISVTSHIYCPDSPRKMQWRLLFRQGQEGEGRVGWRP
jgi:hypothetical protein